MLKAVMFINFCHCCESPEVGVAAGTGDRRSYKPGRTLYYKFWAVASSYSALSSNLSFIRHLGLTCTNVVELQSSGTPSAQPTQFVKVLVRA